MFLLTVDGSVGSSVSMLLYDQIKPKFGLPLGHLVNPSPWIGGPSFERTCVGVDWVGSANKTPTSTPFLPSSASIFFLLYRIYSIACLGHWFG